MLNREKPPIMGMWNGVGGKYEVGAIADEGAIREVFDETGIKVNERGIKVKRKRWVTSVIIQSRCDIRL